MQSYSNHVYLYSYSSKNENLQWYKQTGVGNFKAKMCKFHIFLYFTQIVEDALKYTHM